MEQIIGTWERYVELLLATGMNISPARAIQLSELADRLAGLHEGEAEDCRQMAAFWLAQAAAHHMAPE